MNELNLNENHLTSSKGIAEGFNNYFSNIAQDFATKIGSSNFNFESYVKNTKSEFATFKPVVVSHVHRLLLGLSSNKATGIDKISSKIIKIAAPVISDSLTLIFNQSFYYSILFS